MAHDSSTMTREGHTLRAPVPALSPCADDARTEQDTGAGRHNAHDLGLDVQLNARFAHGVHEDEDEAEQTALTTPDRTCLRADMDVRGPHTARIGYVRAVGVNGVLVRLQHDVYVPFTNLQDVRADRIVLAPVPAHDPALHESLRADTQEDLAMTDGYTVPNTSIFY